MSVRQTTGRPGARLLALAAVLGALVASLAFAMPSRATTHDYCNWDGSYAFLGAGSNCYSGADFLTENHAWLPYLPTGPTIYCAAYLSGSLYGSWVGGNPSCDHTYGGGNYLQGAEQVNSAATTHGQISY